MAPSYPRVRDQAGHRAAVRSRAPAGREPRAGLAGALSAGVDERRFRGEPALVLRSGEFRATFLPRVGMTGVSLRRRGREFLAVPGGTDALRGGHTAGLPLLAPWANRLGALSYRVGRTAVDLRGVSLNTDANGLPIHGLLVGSSGWTIGAQTVRAGVARVRASISVDAPAFPFPHRIDIVAALHDDRLAIATTVVPTARRRVPVAFGWHPYLRVPGTPRAQWGLRLPARRHLALDDRGLPTGESESEPAAHTPIGRRTFDDLYRLGRDRRLAFTTDDGGAIELRAGEGYHYAQVWVPPGRSFAALEPMTAPTDALGRGTAPLVAPGDAYTARFELVPASC